MFARHTASQLIKLARFYPVVTVTGPRQAGKTTLTRATFPNKPYVSLEDEDNRAQARNDPRAFLARYPEGVILDEIQHAPSLLSYIQTIVDNTAIKGMYIVTGSQQMELHVAVSQSLAGRTGLLTLLPLSLAELAEGGVTQTMDEAMLYGGYPRVRQEGAEPHQVYRDYIQTYIERDIRQLAAVQDLLLFRRFIQLLAGRIGQLVNADGLAGEVGVSGPTIKHWMSILEASYLILRLPQYFENFGKRITKQPKIYFTDVGLAAYLLGIETPEQMNRDPLRGNLFENLVFLELAKARMNRGLDPNLYAFRDSNGREVDFLYKRGHELYPIEVKSGCTYNTSFADGVKYFQKLAGDRAGEGFVIYGGSAEQKIGTAELINYTHAAQVITKIE